MARKQKVSNGLSDKASDVVLVLITGIVLFLVAYPLYYVLIASFSNPYDVYAGKTFLFPSDFSFKGYTAVFADPLILTGFLNSVKYTIIGTIFSVVMLYITAYPMAQSDMPGRKFLSIFFIITMYFGGGLVLADADVLEVELILQCGQLLAGQIGHGIFISFWKADPSLPPPDGIIPPEKRDTPAPPAES